MVRSRVLLVFAVSALATGAVCSAGKEPPPITMVSIQVKPLSAVSAPGKTVFFTVHSEGVKGVGAQTPLSVAGAPQGASLEVSALTEEDTLLGIIIPANAAKGRYALSVRIGAPTPVVEEDVALEIGE